MSVPMPRDTEVGALTRAAQTMAHAGARQASRAAHLIRSANDRHEDLALVDALALIETIETELTAYAAAQVTR